MNNFFSNKIFIFSLIVILFYAIILFTYPFVWANYISKTHPPKKEFQVIFGSQSTSAKTLEVTVIGDSTAAGQGGEIVENSFSYQYLQTYLAENNQIKYNNFAVSGSRIDQVLESQILQISSSVDIIFVSIGANDVTAFVSGSNFSAKIQQLTQKLQTFSNAKIIWMSIPDFVTSPILLPPLNYFLSTRAKEFNGIIESSLNQNNFVYVDVFDSTRDEFKNNPDKNFAQDKYHPSTNGYKLWSESVNNTLNLQIK